jgi:TetR/AcrR family transcriptional regulator, cholesterol catabolism regulator
MEEKGKGNIINMASTIGLSGNQPMRRARDRSSPLPKSINRKKDKRQTGETPQKLIDVAIELFAVNGFKSTSIRDIAKAGDMTISNIYYHFGNKEGLLFAILENSSLLIVEELQKAAESDIEPLKRFKLLLKTHIDLLLRVYRRESKILFLDEEYLSRISKQFQVEILEIYRRELQNLQSAGHLSFTNTTIIAFNIFGVINWALRWHKPEGSMPFEQIREELVRFVLYGMLSFSHPEGHTDLLMVD